MRFTVMTMYERLNPQFKKETVRTLIIYLAVALAVNIDRFLLGAHAMVKTHDQFDSYWPFQKALAERIVHFQMPGWLPDFAGGIPFFIWDVNWLFLPMIIHGLFPDPWSVTIITVIQFLLAGFGMHLFLRHFFHTDEHICLLGGLLWALSIFSLTYWRIFDLAALPLLFYCADRVAFALERKTRMLLIAGLLLCAMNLWLIKGALFLVPFHFFFIIFVHKVWTARRKVFVVFTLVWAFVALLNLPMIVSLLVNASHSSRKLIEWIPQDTSLEGMLNSIVWFFFNPVHQSIITLGFVASLLVFFGLFHFRTWDRLTKRLFYYYIAVLFFAQFIIYSSWFIAFWQTLPISGFRLYRLLIIGPFVMFLIAMANVARFLEFIRGPRWRVFLLVIITATVPIATQFIRNVFPSNYIESFVVLVIAIVTLAALMVMRKKGAGTKAYIILFIILIFSERFMQVNLSRPADYQPPSFTRFYSSELYDQFRPAHRYDYRIAFINWHPVVGLYNGYQVAGGIGQYSKRYYYFWDTLITGEDDSKAFHAYYHMAYLYADKIKKEASPAHRISEPGFSTKLLALHNVRYIFSFNEIENPGRWGLSMVHEGTPPERRPGLERGIQVFKRIFNPIPYYVYEINQCLPRAFMASSFDLVEGEEEMKKYLRNNGLNTLRNRVIYNRSDLSPEDMRLLATVKEPSPADDGEDAGTSQPQVAYYSGNKIIVNAIARSPRQLVLNENYFRDWIATVNGRPASILPAYGVFRSVILEKGDNQVVFEYKPLYLIMSLWISGLGSIFFLAVCFWWACAGTTKEKMKPVAQGLPWNVRGGSQLK